VPGTHTLDNAPIRVLIADGDPLICRALARLLSNSAEVEVVATSPDRGEVVRLVQHLLPAVAVMDAHMALPDGVPGTEGLLRQVVGPQIIVLGVYEALRDEALRMGACRFLLKDGARAELMAAIQLAARGECEGDPHDMGENDSFGG
jgi:DNA-binding NarL/FixJ family response regulator